MKYLGKLLLDLIVMVLLGGLLLFLAILFFGDMLTELLKEILGG